MLEQLHLGFSLISLRGNREYCFLCFGKHADYLFTWVVSKLKWINRTTASLFFVIILFKFVFIIIIIIIIIIITIIIIIIIIIINVFIYFDVSLSVSFFLYALP